MAAPLGYEWLTAAVFYVCVCAQAVGPTTLGHEHPAQVHPTQAHPAQVHPEIKKQQGIYLYMYINYHQLYNIDHVCIIIHIQL